MDLPTSPHPIEPPAGPSHGTTSSAELERKFNELEQRLAEVRQLAMQSFQSLSNQKSADFEGLDDFDDHDRRDHGTFGDFLDFCVVSTEGLTSPPSHQQLETSRSSEGTTGLQWHKAVERAGTARRPSRLPPQPSIYDIDLLELHGSVRYKLLRQSMTPEQPQQSLDTLVQRMLYLLASDRYWGRKRAFWFETLAFEKLAPITRYQILPTVEHYCAIQPEFQPTQLQLTRHHWPMVDWIPFPGLRDKIILHAHEIDLTAVVEGTLDSWCLESKEEVPFEDGQREIQVYYRLSEYIDYRRQQSSIPTSLLGRMSKSVETEFVLALRQPNQIFKLEQSYFDRFPMLFTEETLVKGQYRPIVLQPKSPESDALDVPMIGESHTQ
ncbi:uncharacterized protein A1O5_07309 [Cladophialophora psammophila CBS 110553]|uniref:Uncharacterized protein n=1 Tax=Cladophialophora psammophila CBS 110553 TaxID=1182543 RepID=W9WMZ8_9EURO|nr:uncharacterized protein A1O5_07309 [Cladophialophora psammophila CBS 110553]EXJ69273.1 hypothetical protein A1O5_07309 [Cladophialophora psammophila CBS 110553]